MYWGDSHRKSRMIIASSTKAMFGRKISGQSVSSANGTPNAWVIRDPGIWDEYADSSGTHQRHLLRYKWASYTYVLQQTTSYSLICKVRTFGKECFQNFGRRSFFCIILLTDCHEHLLHSGHSSANLRRSTFNDPNRRSNAADSTG